MNKLFMDGARRSLFVAVIVMLSTMRISAQDSPLVGTWEGTYTIQIPDPNSDGIKDEQYKMIIRIKQYDNEFIIKVKTFPVKNPTEVKYWNDCNVTYSDGQQIKWVSYIRTSYDWDNSDRKNGQIIYCVEYTELCTATILKGRLNFVGTMHSVYYNRNRGVITTHDNPAWEVTLYKDDSDW